MSAEALIWKRVSESGEVAPAGFLPGGLEQGILCLVRDNGSTASALSYRAYRLSGDGRGVEAVQQFTVAGLELQPEFDQVARVATGTDTTPSASELPRLVESALPAGSAVLGAVAGSDAAVLLAVKSGASPELRIVATWWEDAGTLVVLPCRLSVPASCLIPAVGSPTPARTQSPPAAVPAVPAPAREPGRRAPAKSRALLWGGGVGLLALATAVLWNSGILDSDVPTTDSLVVALPNAQVPQGGGAETTLAERDSGRVSGGETTQVRPDSAVGGSRGATRTGDAGKSGGATPPSRGGAGTATDSAAKATDAGTKGTGGGTSREPAGKDPIVTPEPLPRLVDSRADKAELRVLYDQSTGGSRLSAAAATAIAVRAEALFGQLKEEQNRSDAARVVLLASAAAGGRPEACKFLGRVAALRATEREFFRTANSCP